MKSSNPVFGFLDRAPSVSRTDAMTVNGTMYKVFFLMMLVVAGMVYAWPQEWSGGAMTGLAIGGLVMALITSFVPAIAWATAPVYAVLEGLLLGVISQYMEVRFPGIAVQAVGLTFGVVFAMAGLYLTRMIVVTDQLRSCIMGATMGIALFYLAGMIASFFGFHLPGYGWSGGWLTIGISLLVVGIASFNLLLDFDSIERGAREGAPRSYEWICAFGLLVTIIWLYIEILRLLALLRERR